VWARASHRPARDPALAQLAADAIQREGSAMPANQINYILVYKANSKGYPCTSTTCTDTNKTMPTTCSGYASCVKFVWQPSVNVGLLEDQRLLPGQRHEPS
jgi:hypothetical protein